MPRLALLAAILVASPASASAADHCRPRPGEQVLARSAEAAVLQKIVKQARHFPRQTITGCSRYSGKRRTLATLQRRTIDDPTKLIGVKLAGTRVAYAMVRRVGWTHLALIADDAIHGGRRQVLGIGDGSEDLGWAVDAQGDVGWITTGYPQGSLPRQDLDVWRPGLGRRLVDSHAVLGAIALRDGVLSWQRNGKPRRVDLASVPATRCDGPKATTGTLDLDFSGDFGFGQGPLTVCARATGKTLIADLIWFWLADANGPYLLLGWDHNGVSGTNVYDLVNGTSEQMVGATGMVVDEHGSLAWVSNGYLVPHVVDEHTVEHTWVPEHALRVRDAAGNRKVADFVEGSVANLTPLRDGSTVTWPGLGVTVTLNP